MAKETEVFRAELDLTDVEKKAARVEQLMSDLKGKRGRGEDTTETERQLHKELDGMAKLGQQEKKAAGTTEQLTKQKEKLGAAMRVTGSAASGLVADIGGLVELLMTGQKAAMGLGAALAGIGIASAVIVKIRQEFKELAEEQERIFRNQQKLKGEFISPQEQMADVLQQFAALTPETEKEAGDVRRRLERARFKRELAVQAAPLAVMEGMDTEQAKLLAQLMVMGVGFEGPGTIKATIAKQPTEVIEAARRQIDAMRPTETGKVREAVAEGQPYGGVGITPEERARLVLIDRKAISEEMTQAKFNEQLRIAHDVAAELESAEAEGRIPQYTGRSGLVGGPGRLYGEKGGPGSPWSVGRYFKEIQGAQLIDVFERERKREMGRLAPAEGPEREGPSTPVTFINIGTATIMPNQTDKPLIGRLGVTGAAGGYLTPLGG